MEVFPPEDPAPNEVGVGPTVSQLEQMKAWDDSFAQLEKVLQAACETKDANNCSEQLEATSSDGIVDDDASSGVKEAKRKWEEEFIGAVEYNKSKLKRTNNTILSTGEVTIQLVGSVSDSCENNPISNMVSNDVKDEKYSATEDATTSSQIDHSDTKESAEFFKIEPNKIEEPDFKNIEMENPTIILPVEKDELLCEEKSSTDFKFPIDFKPSTLFNDECIDEKINISSPINDLKSIKSSNDDDSNLKEDPDSKQCTEDEDKCSVSLPVAEKTSSLPDCPVSEEEEEKVPCSENMDIGTSEDSSDKKKEKREKKEEADKNAKKDEKKKKKFERCNIRDIKLEDELDAVTLSAQKEEQERIRRLQEAQMRALQERLQQIEVEKEALTQLFSQPPADAPNLFDSTSIASTDTLAEGEVKSEPVVKSETDVVLLESSDDDKKAKLQNLIPPPIEENIIDISSSSSGSESDSDDSDKKDDDIMVLSDEGEPESEGGAEDPNNSGAHTNDFCNQPDEEGRVLVNVGHPPEDPDIFLAPQIAKVIKPHQIGGIRFLYDNVVENLERYKSSSGFGCILAHSMGLGKTVQVVSFVDVFLRHTPATLVLCIVPINTIQNWKAEFDMWVPPSTCIDDSQVLSGEVRPRDYNVYTLNENFKTMAARAALIAEWRKQGGVLLMGYEMYRMLALRKMPKIPVKKSKRLKKQEMGVEPETNEQIKKHMDEMYEHIVIPGPDLVICDEGHRIKNSLASTSMALKSIKTRRRVVLTGYPLQNNLLEYWCMVDFVRPNYLGSRAEFCNMFERPISNGQCIDSTPRDRQLMRFRSHVLHSLLVGFVQRRGHSVLRAVLPKKEEHVLLIRMTTIQRQLYKCFVKDLLYVQQATNPLKLFAVCCKIWNHPDILYKLLQEKKAQEDIDLDIDMTSMAPSSSIPGANCLLKKRALMGPKSKAQQRAVKGLPRSIKTALQSNLPADSQLSVLPPVQSLISVKSEICSDQDHSNNQQIDDLNFSRSSFDSKDEYSTLPSEQMEFSQQGSQQTFQSQYASKKGSSQYCQQSYQQQYQTASQKNSLQYSQNQQQSQHQFSSQSTILPQQYSQQETPQTFSQTDAQISQHFSLQSSTQQEQAICPQSPEPQSAYQSSSAQPFSSQTANQQQYPHQNGSKKQFKNSSQQQFPNQASSKQDGLFQPQSPSSSQQSLNQNISSQGSSHQYSQPSGSQQNFLQQSYQTPKLQQYSEQQSSQKFPQAASIGSSTHGNVQQQLSDAPISHPFTGKSQFQRSPPHSQFSQNHSSQFPLPSPPLPAHQQFHQQTSPKQFTPQQSFTQLSPSPQFSQQPSPQQSPTQSQFSQASPTSQKYTQQFSQQSPEYSQQPSHQQYQQNVQQYAQQQQSVPSQYSQGRQPYTEHVVSQQYPEPSSPHQQYSQPFPQSYNQPGYTEQTSSQTFSQHTSQNVKQTAQSQFQTLQPSQKFQPKTQQQSSYPQTSSENVQFPQPSTQTGTSNQICVSPTQVSNKQPKFNQQKQFNSQNSPENQYSQSMGQSTQYCHQTSQSPQQYTQTSAASQFAQQVQSPAHFSPQLSKPSQFNQQTNTSQSYTQQTATQFNHQSTTSSKTYGQASNQVSQYTQPHTAQFPQQSTQTQQYTSQSQNSQQFSQQNQLYSQQQSTQYAQQNLQASQTFSQQTPQASQQYTQQGVPTHYPQQTVQPYSQQSSQSQPYAQQQASVQFSQQLTPSPQYLQQTTPSPQQYSQSTTSPQQFSQQATPSPQQFSQQPAQSQQQFPQQPTPSPQQFPQQPALSPQQFSQQSAPSSQQFSQQPAPSPQQFSQQPVPSPQQFPQQPTPSPQQFPQQPTPSPQQYSQQPSPQQFSQQPSPSPQQFSQQPSPSPQQFSQQPTATPQQFPQQPTPSQQFSQTAAAPQQFSQQPVPSPQQFPQQPAPSPQQFSQQPASSSQQFSQQPVPSPQQFPQQLSPSSQQFSQQPMPSPQQFSQQPTPSPQQFPQQPTPTSQQFSQQTASSSQQFPQQPAQTSPQYPQQPAASPQQFLQQPPAHSSQQFPQQPTSSTQFPQQPSSQPFSQQPAASTQQFSQSIVQGSQPFTQSVQNTTTPQQYSQQASSHQYKQQSVRNAQPSQYSIQQQCHTNMPSQQYQSTFAQPPNQPSVKTGFQQDFQSQQQIPQDMQVKPVITQPSNIKQTHENKTKPNRSKPVCQPLQTPAASGKPLQSFSHQGFQNDSPTQLLPQRQVFQQPQNCGNQNFQSINSTIASQDSFSLQHIKQENTGNYSSKCPKAILQPVKSQQVSHDAATQSQLKNHEASAENEMQNISTSSETNIAPLRDRMDSSINYEWAVPIMKDYVLGVLENSHKMMVLFVIISETLHMGDKLLVFSQSLSTLDLLEHFLSKIQVPQRQDEFDIPTNETWCRNKNYFRLDGSTSAQEREKLINEFNRNDNVSLFLLSTRAGCLGINLVGANRIVVMDASWNPCHDAQAVCRIYRYGQKKQCHIYRLVTDNSLEKRIYDRQVNKQGMSDRVVDELNPESNFTWKDVTTLIQDDEDDGPVQELSKFNSSYSDSVLKYLVSEMSPSLSKEPFEHESLLLDRKDLKLTKHEKRLAKQSYEMAKRANMINIRTTYTYLPAGGAGGGQFIINNKPCQWVGGTTIRVLPNQSTSGTGNARSGTTATPITASPSLMSSLFKQGVMVQKLTMPSNVSIPVLTPGAPPVVIPAGQDVLVLRTPKGVYLRLPDGRIIAVQLPPSLLAKTQFRPNVVTHFRPAAPKGTNQSSTVINTPRGQSIGIIKQTLQCGGTVRYSGPRTPHVGSAQNASRSSAPEVIDLSDDDEPSIRKSSAASNMSTNSSGSESGSNDQDQKPDLASLLPGKQITIRKLSPSTQLSTIQLPSSKEKCELPQMLTKNKQITIMPINPSTQQNRQKMAPQLAQPLRVQQMLLQPQQGKRKPPQKAVTKIPMTPLFTGKNIRPQITITPQTSIQPLNPPQKLSQSVTLLPQKMDSAENSVQQVITSTMKSSLADLSSKQLLEKTHQTLSALNQNELSVTPITKNVPSTLSQVTKAITSCATSLPSSLSQNSLTLQQLNVVSTLSQNSNINSDGSQTMTSVSNVQTTQSQGVTSLSSVHGQQLLTRTKSSKTDATLQMISSPTISNVQISQVHQQQTKLSPSLSISTLSQPAPQLLHSSAQSGTIQHSPQSANVQHSSQSNIQHFTQKSQDEQRQHQIPYSSQQQISHHSPTRMLTSATHQPQVLPANPQVIPSRKRKSSNRQPSKKSQHSLLTTNQAIPSSVPEVTPQFLHSQVSDHHLPESHFSTFSPHGQNPDFSSFTNFTTHKSHIQHPQPLHPLQHSQEHSLPPHLQHMSHLYPMPSHIPGSSSEMQPQAPRAWPVPQPSVSSFHPFSQSSPYYSSGQENSQFPFKPSSFPLPQSSVAPNISHSDSSVNAGTGVDQSSRNCSSEL